MDEFLSKYQLGFLEGLWCTTQPVDNSQAYDTLLTDLSKAFDCLPDGFLIEKSNAHGFRL